MSVPGSFWYTTGTRGCGKTMSRACIFVLREWLPNHSGVHLSNFPWRFDDWQEPILDADGNEQFDESGKLLVGGPMLPGLVTMAKRETRLSEEEIRRRVQVIPSDVMQSWHKLESGPWEYFADKRLSGYHIAIDEVHNFCPCKGMTRTRKGEQKSHEQKWQEWLGESRHLGCTIEFISQTPLKVHRMIDAEADLKLQLSSADPIPDFFFGIPCYDWYNLVASFTGFYQSSTWQQTSREELEGWKVVEQQKFKIERRYFTIYNSHSKPQAGGLAGKQEEKEWKRFSRLRLIGWFLARNWLKLAFGSRNGMRGGLFAIFLITFLTAFNGTAYSIQGLYWGLGKIQEQVDSGLASKQAASSASPVSAEPQTKKTDYQRNLEAGGMRANKPLKRSSRNALTQECADGEGQGGANSVAVVDESAEELAALREDWRLGVIWPDGIVFCGGGRYGIGEVIDDGPYRGQTLQTVDMQGRWAQVGPHRLRLGVPCESRLCERWVSVLAAETTGIATESRPRVERPLSSVVVQPSEAPTDNAARAPGNDVSGGDASGRVPATYSDTVRRSSGGGVGIGQRNGHDRSDESTSVPSVTLGGSAGGSGVN